MQTIQNRQFQRGLGLIQVAVLMAALAGVAMVAMMSMRNERNYFADALGKLTGQVAPAAGPGAVAGPAEPKEAPAAPAGVLRKCTINGKLVLSDTDCGSAGTVVKPLATRGVVAPKAAQPEPEQVAGTSMQDKMIEKATR